MPKGYGPHRTQRGNTWMGDWLGMTLPLPHRTQRGNTWMGNRLGMTLPLSMWLEFSWSLLCVPRVFLRVLWFSFLVKINNLWDRSRVHPCLGAKGRGAFLDWLVLRLTCFIGSSYSACWVNWLWNWFSNRKLFNRNIQWCTQSSCLCLIHNNSCQFF